MISGKTPIAIIGIGCRFPGSSDDPSSFWQLLVDGKDVVREITPDRWSIDKHYSPKVGVPGKSYSKWAGLLDDIDRFEPEFFGISPREAHYMDPQQRILLEVAWSALEDAGLPAEQISGTKTGVYVGISTNDYAQLESSSDQHLVDAHSATGGAFSIAANRISYCFDLRGPSMVVDTACSSSLVSTHLACNSLWNGECDMALAGGVNIIIGPGPFIAFSSATMLSPDGRCKAFDASANGFVRGEGAGMVLLKPLDKALADGDTIYATIAATGVNQDARTQGITLPSRQAQQALLAQVYGEAGIAPSDVWYVEAHGTGTGVGDPIETNALGNVFSQDREDAFPLNIGSVKTNIGHLEAGAGIAGLIKACLALKHRTLPPSLHFNEPNPKIPFDGLKLKVVNELTRVDDHLGKPLVAGVNSFGFGGTNAHVVLQEFTQSEPQGARTAHTQASYLMPLSAYSEEGLEALVKAYLNFVTQEGQTASLADICSTAACRRSHFDQRLALVVSDKEELVERFQAFIDGERRPGMSTGRREGGDERRLAFVFSGQGPQWWRMARELLDTNAVFRAKIEQVDTLVRELGDWSLLEELGADEAHSRMHDTRYAQPALFALQVGLVEVLKQWGVVPDAVVGHSVGEVAAAHVCGALSLEQAVKVIYHRGRCMASAPGGRMLALGVPFEEAEPLAASHQGRVSVAANNSPVSVTLSGDGEALESVAAQFENSSTYCRFLPVKYAFHSAHMEPIREELMAALEGIEAVPAQLPVYSAVTGEAIDGTALGAEYWWRNVRQPVRFADAIGRLAEEEHTFFVELSPHPVLGTSISQCLGQNHRSNVVVPTLRRDTSDNVQMLGAVGMLYTAGYPVNWRRLWPLPGSFVQLPGYQWQRASYWHEPKPTREFRIGRLEHPLLAKRFQLTDPTWEVQLTTRLMPYLGDHRVQGRTVVPAAAYVEMALAAGYALSSGEAPVLEEMRFTKALFLPDAGDAHRVQFNNSVEDGKDREPRCGCCPLDESPGLGTGLCCKPESELRSSE